MGKNGKYGSFQPLCQEDRITPLTLMSKTIIIAATLYMGCVVRVTEKECS
jgi:hypothetical protein